MDVNVENSAVREEVRAEKKKQDIKGIIWTVVGVMIFTVLIITCEKTPSDEVGCGMNRTSFSFCISPS